MSVVVAVVHFPGTNRETDMCGALRCCGAEPVLVSHQAVALPERTRLLVLPGGFSYGDYLRCGAVAARTPIMDAVRAFAHAGGLVLGVCNGFQILCEAGLLPGALLPNAGGRFICRVVSLQTEASESASAFYVGASPVLWPAAHGDGRYHADAHTPSRVLYRYVDDVNGSVARIAGILNAAGNVCGMMPHPENAVDADGATGTDGVAFWERLLRAAAA